MAALTRTVVLASIGLAAAFVLPAIGQTPCNNADSINCDYHPDYGWIIRGSAPQREQRSESATNKELEEWRKKNRDPDAARREAERRRDQREFDAKYRTADEIVRNAAWFGTCPPEWTERTGGDPRVSYQLTLRACGGGDMDRCRALQTVCKGDSMEPYKGHCRFGFGVSQSTYDIQNKWTDQVILENRTTLETACMTERQAWACSTLARDYTFLRAPHAQPSKAYAYTQRACQLEGPQSMDCVVLREGCIAGGPSFAMIAPAPQPPASSTSATPSPSQQARGFSVEPLRAPSLPNAPAQPDSRWLNEKPRPCTYPSVSQAWRDQANARSAEENLKSLRIAEEHCLEHNNFVSCTGAARLHVLLTIPEAKPEKAWDLLSRACQFDSRACDVRSKSCPGE